MKKLFLLISCLLLAITVYSQPCAHEGIGFYSQEEVDRFHKNYPNCTLIQGDIIIAGDDIKYLDSLQSITEIQGYLEVSHTVWLGSLKGLDNIRKIGGHFGIYSNEGLADVLNLKMLDSIGGNFEIFGNKILTDLKGIDTLRHIKGDLWIGSNPAMDSVLGLKNLNTIEGMLQINDNLNMKSLGSLMGLKRLGGAIYVASNPVLEKLTGLDSINAGTMTGLFLSDNPQLTFCNVFSICRYLELQHTVISIYNNSNGCESLQHVQTGCDTMAVETRNARPLLSVYPNPVSGIVNVETGECPGGFTLSVLNAEGEQLLWRNIVGDRAVISLETYPKGVYLLRVSGRSFTETRKLIKM